MSGPASALPTESRGADARIVAAVEMLRSLQVDGFNVPLLVELALGPVAHPGDYQPAEERAAILHLYREALDPSLRRPVISMTPGERPSLDPQAAVFANFETAWPRALTDEARKAAIIQWQRLSAADRQAAIKAIPALIDARETNGLAGRPPSAHAYLSAGNWRGLR